MDEPTIPPRPDTSPRPAWVTVVALLLALVGSALALPFAVQTYPLEPYEDPVTGVTHAWAPQGWQRTLWSVAFWVGSSSFVLALVARHKERQRRSKAGRRLAVLALVLAIVGGCVWGFPACIEASTGL